MNLSLSKKQLTAFKLLTQKREDNQISIVFYGGAANSGKSWLMATFLITQCLSFPGIRCALGRSTLKALKSSTLETIKKVLKSLSLKENVDYIINLHNGYLEFNNNTLILDQNGKKIESGKSKIEFLHLAYMPSDPNYDRFGSFEYGIICADEISQIDETCFNVLVSRLRAVPATYQSTFQYAFLGTLNPDYNWVRSKIYEAHLNQQLPNNYSFIQANIHDNKKAEESNILALQSLPSYLRKRLYEGDWDFQDEDNQLFKANKLQEIFSQEELADVNSPLYASIDLAGMGDDQTIIAVWHGFTVIDIKRFSKLDPNFLKMGIKDYLDNFRYTYVDKNKSYIKKIEMKNVIFDANGIGNHIPFDPLFKSSVAYLGTNAAFNNKRFGIKRVECYYYMMVTKFNVKSCVDTNELTAQLLAMKDESNEVNKFKITKKEDVKRKIGKSPDLMDALVMRFHFCSKPSNSFSLLTPNNI
jgi:hypothetical protein